MAQTLYSALRAASCAERRWRSSNWPRERLIGSIFEAAPAVVANAEIGQSLEYSAGVGAGGIDDVGRDHGDIESMLANEGDKRRKVFGGAGGIDMAARADGEVDSIEADVGSGARQFSAFEELEMF